MTDYRGYDVIYADAEEKFVKGVVIGGLLVTGAAMMYTEMGKSTKRKMMKKGRQMIKKMGLYN